MLSNWCGEAHPLDLSFFWLSLKYNVETRHTTDITNRLQTLEATGDERSEAPTESNCFY